jgi:hypothetical protein
LVVVGWRLGGGWLVCVHRWQHRHGPGGCGLRACSPPHAHGKPPVGLAGSGHAWVPVGVGPHAATQPPHPASPSAFHTPTLPPSNAHTHTRPTPPSPDRGAGGRGAGRRQDAHPARGCAGGRGAGVPAATHGHGTDTATAPNQGASCYGGAALFIVCTRSYVTPQSIWPPELHRPSNPTNHASQHVYETPIGANSSWWMGGRILPPGCAGWLVRAIQPRSAWTLTPRS